jgi:hypothetical protein
MEYLSGLVLGFIGSLHCIGMCGPIAIALPRSADNKFLAFVQGLLYNVGRIITYFVLGLIFGTIGTAFRINGLQEALSIGLGVLILLTFFMPKKIKSGFLDMSIIKTVSTKFKKMFQSLFAVKLRLALFVIGLLNGLLPCGLVYVALAASMVMGGALESGFYMLLFGLGTIPLMLLAFLLRSVIPANIRLKLSGIVPVGVAIVAVLLILRGLSLGIPYISPVLPSSICSGQECCH